MACQTCLPIDCQPGNDLGLYDLTTAQPRGLLAASAPAINCRVVPDLDQYSLQSGYFFTNIEYGFVLDCPPGYSCAPGYYPQVIVIPPDSITINVPASDVSNSVLATPFSANLTCCNTTIPIFAPTGTSLTALEAIITAAFQQCAAAKAACLNLKSPHPGVRPPIKISGNITAPQANCCLGVAYESTMLAPGIVLPAIWDIVTGALPDGLYIEDSLIEDAADTGTNTIQGTPTVAGNFTFTVQVAGADGSLRQKTFSISVLGISNAPPDGTVGTPYSFQFTAAGGVAPYMFSVPPGNLPDGLTMDSTGLVTGTPTVDIPVTFTVTVTDSSP